ncbi:actin cytoskeleton and mitosis protein [Vanrija albida]|uniref:Actin cytoskeleton and mitosis protein n=1 Tax=Vanrija albida TaxID=181172 RepID=A0ABR3Q2R3_9TREE
MAPPPPAVGVDSDGDDDFRRADRRAARAARFNTKLEGNRYKELEAARAEERKAFLEQGLISSGKTTLGDAVDMRGTCEDMCPEYEREFREYTREIHPFEALPNRRMDHSKAVAAYTRSDAGAGHGAAVKLPSDLRTPQALVRSLDYLIDKILPLQPPVNPNAVNPPAPTARRALGNSAGFIRDRTRAIRKEFAMQSSWGHDEAIATFERIARWHILCLRELQEETGTNTDMHIDSAELGRCFTSLRQQYNDRREELGVDTPCPNEPEFRAYMLIFDLANKSVSIPTAELPAAILDHPLVKLAWQIRQTAQRNFDMQKEGSKLNAELGANLLTRFVRLLKQGKVPYLLSCLVEIRLRDIRRSALRALTRTYPRLKAEPIRYSDSGEVLERRMVLFDTLDTLLGAEEQEDDGPAWDDIEPVSKNPDDESAAIVERFGIEVFQDVETGPVGALVNLAARFNDNKDAPFTRRWKLITEKKGDASYSDIINGYAGVEIDGTAALRPATISVPRQRPVYKSTPAVPKVTPAQQPAAPAKSIFDRPGSSSSASAFSSTGAFAKGGAFTNGSAFANGGGSAFSTSTSAASAFKPAQTSAFAPAPKTQPMSSAIAPATPTPPVVQPVVSTTPTAPPPAPSFFKSQQTQVPPKTTEPQPKPVPSFFGPTPPTAAETPKPTPLPSFFDTPTQAGPSKDAPTFFPSPSTTPAAPPPKPPSPKLPSPPRPPPVPVIPRIKMSHAQRRAAPFILSRQLVDEVVDQILQSVEPDLAKIIHRQEAAQRHRESVAQRQAFIKQCSDLIFDRLVEDEVTRVAERVHSLELRAQALAQKVAKHWLEWTRRKVALQAKMEQAREQTFTTLQSMGLSRSTASFAGASRSSLDPVRLRSTRREEAEVNMELRRAERVKNQLHAPSTFLYTIARHVAPLLEEQAGEEAPLWETVLLTAENAGSPANREARSWLIRKLTTTTGHDVQRDGVDFATTVSEADGEFPGSVDTGLFILEAPTTIDQKIPRNVNADDAQDRLEAAIGVAKQQSRYMSSLLILTWETESLDQVVSRLEIGPQVSQFDAVAVFSLDGAEDLDNRFGAVVRSLVPRDPLKGQVVVQLKDLVAITEPLWQRLYAFAEHVLAKFPKDAGLNTKALALSVDLLRQLGAIIDSVFEELPVSDNSTYALPDLPPFPAVNSGDNASIAEAIAAYLSQPPLSHVDDVALALGPLRQAAAQGRPLPILPVLWAIASYFFGTLTLQRLPLDQWLPGNEPAEAVDKLAIDVQDSFSSATDQAVQDLARVANEARLALAAATPLPPTPTKRSPTKGKKRRADDAADSKVAKNARLLRALAEANATLNQLDPSAVSAS